MYGGFAIERSGVAPEVRQVGQELEHVRPVLRVVVGVQGVGVCAPASSFSAIVGVWQPVTETA